MKREDRRDPPCWPALGDPPARLASRRCGVAGVPRGQRVGAGLRRTRPRAAAGGCRDRAAGGGVAQLVGRQRLLRRTPPLAGAVAWAVRGARDARRRGRVDPLGSGRLDAAAPAVDRSPRCWRHDRAPRRLGTHRVRPVVGPPGRLVGIPRLHPVARRAGSRGGRPRRGVGVELPAGGGEHGAGCRAVHVGTGASQGRGAAGRRRAGRCQRGLRAAAPGAPRRGSPAGGRRPARRGPRSAGPPGRQRGTDPRGGGAGAGPHRVGPEQRRVRPRA
jgi:hypothetical protein